MTSTSTTGMKDASRKFLSAGMSAGRSGFEQLKRRTWLVLLLLCLATGAAGYGLHSLQTDASSTPVDGQVGDEATVPVPEAYEAPTGEAGYVEPPPSPESKPGFLASLLSSAPERVTIPPGTALVGVLSNSVSSRGPAGQSIHVSVTRPVFVGGKVAIPAGSHLVGSVLESRRSGRIKGRARVTIGFNRLETPTGSYHVVAGSITHVAKGTKKRDAGIIGIGAGVGAAIGALAGGGKGAAIGALAGGGAGTGVVLATRGKETGFSRGEHVSVRLIEPVVVHLQKS